MDDSQVKIYSAPWCAFCHMTKNYLDKLGIKYQEVDVDKDHTAARQLVEKTGQTGIPVLEVGDKTIIGFDKMKIDEALKSIKQPH